MEEIIDVQNLRKAYKKETVVENVCFELMPGSIMGLLGTNGAGKTTTLKMIILDEPANGLDPQGQINLYRLICDMAKERNTTFIVSSHQLHDMEKFCTDILILDKGKSILQGKTEEILSDTTNLVDCILEETKAARNVLSGCQGISLVSQKGNQFTIRLENICFDEFVKKLVANHLHILYLSIRKHSLQDLFLKLTGGTESWFCF